MNIHKASTGGTGASPRLRERIVKAQAASLFAQVVLWAKSGTVKVPKVVQMPGTAMKRYSVTLHRRLNRVEAGCVQDLVGRTLRCQGNTAGVCYHVLAALLVAAQAQGRRVYFCGDLPSATVLKGKTGGTLAAVDSAQGVGRLWMVVVDWPAAEALDPDGRVADELATEAAEAYGAVCEGVDERNSERALEGTDDRESYPRPSDYRPPSVAEALRKDPGLAARLYGEEV